MSRCTECSYWWDEECHWESYCPDDIAPCEYNDEPDYIDGDCGFDPYAGQYTWDC